MSSEQTPLVSIAMCTYNGEQFIREQLESLIAQDYQNLEMIIVDDCSTDSTYAILEEYSSAHESIKLYSNSKNLGFKRNFERALKLCNGSFIALCDQDDIWFSNKISTYVEQIDQYSLVYSQVELINEQGQKLDEKFPSVNLLEGRCHLSLLFGNCVTGHACMLRKEILRYALPIPQGVKLHDHWLALVAAASQGIKKVSTPLSQYRKHQQNAVFRKKKKHVKSKLARRISSYQDRLNFLSEAIRIEPLKEDEARYIDQIKTAYSKYKRTIINKELSNLIKQREETLALYKSPKTARRKICRGLILDLL